MIQLILDTYKDRRNAYWFQIGPRGSIGDAIISENGAAFNKAWNGLERYLYSFSGHAKHLERQGGMKDIHHSNWHISKNEI